MQIEEFNTADDEQPTVPTTGSQALELNPTRIPNIPNPTPGNAQEVPPEQYRRPNFVIEPRRGQIWCGCYESNEPRYLLVEQVSPAHVLCSTLRTGKESVIRRNRLKPGSRGYRYVGEIPELETAVNQLHNFWMRRAVRRLHERARGIDAEVAAEMSPIGYIAAPVCAEEAS
jgi:hypothetical protein